MSAFWMSALADAAVRATALLAIAAAITALLRHRSAALRHFVWALALVGVLGLPLAGAVLPRVPVPMPMPWTAAGELSASAVNTGPASAPPLVQPQAPAVFDHPAGSTAAAVGTGGEGRATTPSAGAVRTGAVTVIGASETASPNPAAGPPSTAWKLLPLLAIWGAGAVAFAAWSLAGIWNTRRLVAQATPVTAREWLEPLRNGCARLDIRRPVRLLQSDRVAMPMTWGWRRPAILLPATATAWPSARRTVVLRHELAHVKRADVVTQLLAQWACTIHWFNPIVWLAAFRLRVEREQACDDEVLRLGTRASDYANHLLAIARECRAPGLKPSAAMAMARPSQLERRMRAILDPDVRRSGGRPTAVLAAVVLTGAVLAVSVVTPTTEVLPGRTAAGGRGQTATAGLPGSAPNSEPSEAATAPSPGATAAGPTQPESVSEPWFEDWHRVAQDVFAAVVWHFAEARRQLGDTTAGVQPTAQGAGAAAPPTQPEPPGAGSGAGSDPVTAAAPAGARRGRLEVLQAEARQPAEPMRAGAERIGVSAEAVQGVRPMRARAERMRASDIDAIERRAREQPSPAIEPRLVETFIDALRDADTGVRARAARALGRHRVHEAADALRRALDDQDGDVRERAAWALGRIRYDGAVDDLLRLLQDPMQDVRERAAWALGAVRNPAAVDGLVAALDGADAPVQERIAWALGRIRDPGATEGLIAALPLVGGDALREVVAALGRIGGERAMNALIGLMDASSPEVRRAVIDALSAGNWISRDAPPRKRPSPGFRRIHSRRGSSPHRSSRSVRGRSRCCRRWRRPTRRSRRTAPG